MCTKLDEGTLSKDNFIQVHLIHLLDKILHEIPYMISSIVLNKLQDCRLGLNNVQCGSRHDILFFTCLYFGSVFLLL